MIYILVIVSPALSLLLAVLGILVALPAGIASWKTARSTRWGSSAHFLKGAVYSLLFVIPLVFLWGKLEDRRALGCFLLLAYLFLYSLWAGIIWSVEIFGMPVSGIRDEIEPFNAFLLDLGVPLVLISLIPPVAFFFSDLSAHPLHEGQPTGPMLSRLY